MKALILVGGFGTRLRPLTFSVPKSAVEFVNVPMIEYQIEALAKVGVTEFVLAIAYNPELIEKYAVQFEKKYNVKIICNKEDVPLGTAGPLRLAEKLLKPTDEDELFFCLNSDVMCEFPFADLLKFHKSHNQEGTIMLTQVEDPSRFGVIVREESTGQIKSFVEKPKEFISNKINAGLYLLNTRILKRIPQRPCSIEREIFPQMVKDGVLYSFILQGFWKDVGLPGDLIKGTGLYLNSLREKNSDRLSTRANNQGNVIVHETAQVHESAVLGPDVVVGPGCVVGEGARIKNSILYRASKVGDHSFIEGSIIGWTSTVGKWVRMNGLSCLGEDVQIKDELYINGCFILPNKSIGESQPTKGTILM